MSTGYACKECSSPATVSSAGKIFRSCEHSGTIITTLKATVYGESWARASIMTKLEIKLRNALRFLLRAIVGVKKGPSTEA